MASAAEPTTKNIRLLELDPSRRWQRSAPPPPPVEDTRREIEARLRQVAAQRAAVFAAIDQERSEVVACLQALVRIPSVTTGDHPLPDDRFEQDLADHVVRGTQSSADLEPFCEQVGVRDKLAPRSPEDARWLGWTRILGRTGHADGRTGHADGFRLATPSALRPSWQSRRGAPG